MPASSFQARQQELAAYIRDPVGRRPPAGIEGRRARLYARLVFNNIESALERAFPIFNAITAEDDWHVLVRDFVRRHHARTPYYRRLGGEFVDFLEGLPAGAARPFAEELCHYEWMRRSLDDAPDVDCAYDDEPVAPDDALRLSPLAVALRYLYPVQRIAADFQPAEPPPEPTLLIVCRDRHGTVTTIESNAVTMRLLALLEEGKGCRESFEIIAGETELPLDRIERTGMEMLEKLHRADVVVRC